MAEAMANQYLVMMEQKKSHANKSVAALIEKVSKSDCSLAREGLKSRLKKKE